MAGLTVDEDRESMRPLAQDYEFHARLHQRSYRAAAVRAPKTVRSGANAPAFGGLDDRSITNMRFPKSQSYTEIPEEFI